MRSKYFWLFLNTQKNTAILTIKNDWNHTEITFITQTSGKILIFILFYFILFYFLLFSSLCMSPMFVEPFITCPRLP